MMYMYANGHSTKQNYEVNGLKKIVIVGAGYSGVLTAKKLAKKLKNPQEYSITIIDKNPYHTMLTELHEVAAQRVEEDSVKISLARVFARRNVKVVLDTVEKVDKASGKVLCKKGSYDYDYLVIATGSKPTFFGVPGAEENTFTLWSLDDAVKLREHIVEVFRAASKEADLEEKRRLLSFATVGTGFTGVEMAGELAELVPSLCERFEIDRELVTMYDIDMLDRVCTVLPEKLSAKVQRRLEKMRVQVKLKTNILAVGEDYLECKSGDKTMKIQAYTKIWTAGIEGSDFAYESKEFGEAARGRIQTDEFLRSQNDKNVFVAGDNIFYIPEGEKSPVPQMIENCEQSADCAAHNILASIKGGEMEVYKPKMHGVMVCIGGRYGVAHIGSAKTKIGLPSFLAMFVKHFMNIIYFVQVLGWNKIFSYLNHEFFQIRNKRSFVGGHFSNRSASFLGVPLRMYLGFYWVYEAILKMLEGWMTSPKLGAMITGTNAWYDSVLSGGADAASGATDAASSASMSVVDSAVQTVQLAASNFSADVVSMATDAASGATGTATAAATDAFSGILIDWDILGLLRIILLNIGDVACKVQVGLVDWMMNSFVVPNDTMQMVMQITIVLLELFVGLALMGGLFTTIAGGGSIVLQMMFLTTTGLYMHSWWMIFASLAVMFGAGRVFSMDYYVMPWLKKRFFQRVRFFKKWYLYND